MTGVAGRAKTVVADPELSVALQRTLVAGIARRDTLNTRPKAFVERLCGPRYSSFSILPRFTGFMNITYGVIVHKVRLREIVLGAVNLISNRGFSSVAFGLIFGISLNLILSVLNAARSAILLFLLFAQGYSVASEKGGGWLDGAISEG